MSRPIDLRRALAAPPLPADFAKRVLHQARRRGPRGAAWTVPLAAAAVIGAVLFEQRPGRPTEPVLPSAVAVTAVAPVAPAHALAVDPAWSMAALVLGRAERIAARPAPPDQGRAAPIVVAEPRTLSALRQSLYGANAVERELAAAELASRSAPAAQTVLLDALEVRGTAATAARALAAAEVCVAAPAIRRALAGWLDGSQATVLAGLLPAGTHAAAARDARDARALLAALAAIGDADDLQVCVRALAHPALHHDAHAALVLLSGTDRGPEPWRWRCWLSGSARPS